ncbi:hypothetical protein D1P53_003410 [Cryptococcus gattii VGV]|nr:hypothetical protein D1P53_003410 [Cryptococcus gattii VGV]
MVRTVQEPLPTTPQLRRFTTHSQPSQQNNANVAAGKPRTALQERTDNVILPLPKPQSQKGKAQAYKAIPKLVNRPSRSPMRPKVSEFVANSPQRIQRPFSSLKENSPLPSRAAVYSHGPRTSMPLPVYGDDETLLIDMSLPGDFTLGGFETTDESDDDTVPKRFGGFKGLMTPDNSQEVDRAESPSLSRTIKKVATARPSQKTRVRLPTPPASQPLPIETFPPPPSTLRVSRVRARHSPTPPRRISTAPAEILRNNASGFNARVSAVPSPNPRSKKKSRMSDERDGASGRKSVEVTIPMRRMPASPGIEKVQTNVPSESHKSLGKGKGRASSSRTPIATLSQSISGTRRVSGGSNSSSQSHSKTPAAPRTKAIPATAPARRRLSKAPNTSRKEPVKRRASTGMALIQSTSKSRAKKGRTTVTQEMFQSMSGILEDPIHGSPGDDPLLLKGVSREEMEWDGEVTRDGLEQTSGLGLQVESRDVVQEPIPSHRTGLSSSGPSPSITANATQSASREPSPFLPTLYNRFENGEIDVGQYDDWSNDFGGGWSDDDSLAGEDTFLHVKERHSVGEQHLAVIEENVVESPFIPRMRSMGLMQEEQDLPVEVTEKEGEVEANAQGDVTLEAEEGIWDEELTIRNQARAVTEPEVPQQEKEQNRTDGEVNVMIEAESNAWDELPVYQDNKVESSNRGADEEPCNAIIKTHSPDLPSSPQVNATRSPSPKLLATPRQETQPPQLRESPAVRNAEEQNAPGQSRQMSVAGPSPTPPERLSPILSSPTQLTQHSSIPHSPTHSKRPSHAPPSPTHSSYSVHPVRSPSQAYSPVGSLRPLSPLPPSPILKGLTQEAPEPDIEAVERASSPSSPGRSPRRSFSQASYQSPALLRSTPHHASEERFATRSPLILIKHRGEVGTASPTKSEHNHRPVSHEPMAHELAQNEDEGEKDDILVRAERMIARLSVPLSPHNPPLLREETPALIVQAASPEISPASQPFIASAQTPSSSVGAHRFATLSPASSLGKPRTTPPSSLGESPQPQLTPRLQTTPLVHECAGTSPMISPISTGSSQHTPIPQFRLYPGETPLMDASYREPTLGFRRGTPHPKIELASPATDCSPFGPQGSASQLRLSLQRQISADSHSDSSLSPKGRLLLSPSSQAGSPIRSPFRESTPTRRSPNLSPSTTMKKNTQTSPLSPSCPLVFDFPQGEVESAMNSIQASKAMDSHWGGVHLKPMTAVTPQTDAMGVEESTDSSINQETASAVHAQSLAQDINVEDEVGPDGRIECSTNSVVAEDVEGILVGPSFVNAHAIQTLQPGDATRENGSIEKLARFLDGYGDDEQNVGNDSGLTEMTDKTVEGDSAAWNISAASLNESLERSNELGGIEKTCKRQEEGNGQDTGADVCREGNMSKNEMGEKNGEEDGEKMEEMLSENEQDEDSEQENVQEEISEEDEENEPGEAQDKIVICVVKTETVKVEPGLEDDVQERRSAVSEIPDRRCTPALWPPLYSSGAEGAEREPSMQPRRTPTPSRLISASTSSPQQEVHQWHTPIASSLYKQVTTQSNIPALSTPHANPSAPVTPSDMLYPSLNNLDSPLSISTSFITSTPTHDTSSNPTAISNERPVFRIAGENTPQCISALEKMFPKKAVGHSKLSQQVIPSSSPSRADPDEMEKIQVDETVETSAEEKSEDEPHKSNAECDMSADSQDNNPEANSSVQIRKPRRSLHDELAAVVRDEDGGDSSFKSVVEVSSLDPKAAARAAAILKLNHSYIEHGVLSRQNPDVSSTTNMSHSSLLDKRDLLHEAELEIVSQRRSHSRSMSRAMSLSREWEASREVRREREMSAMTFMTEDYPIPGGYVKTPIKRRHSPLPHPHRHFHSSFGRINTPGVVKGKAKERANTWGVSEWKRLEKTYRSEKEAWIKERELKALPGGLVSWARRATFGSNSRVEVEPWDAQRVVEKFLDGEGSKAGNAEWDKELVLLRVQAIERRLNHIQNKDASISAVIDTPVQKKARKNPEDIDISTKTIHTPLAVPHFQLKVEEPPSTIKRMLGFIWGGANKADMMSEVKMKGKGLMKEFEAVQGKDRVDEQMKEIARPEGVPPPLTIASQSAPSPTPSTVNTRSVSTPNLTTATSVPSTSLSSSALASISFSHTSRSSSGRLYPPLDPSLSQRSSAIAKLFPQGQMITAVPPPPKEPIKLPSTVSGLQRSRTGSVKDLAKAFEEKSFELQK